MRIDPRGPIDARYVLAVGRLVGASVEFTPLMPRFSIYRLEHPWPSQRGFSVLVGTGEPGGPHHRDDPVPAGACPVWIPR